MAHIETRFKVSSVQNSASVENWFKRLQEIFQQEEKDCSLLINRTSDIGEWKFQEFK